MIKVTLATLLALAAMRPAAFLCAQANTPGTLNGAFSAWADGRPEEAAESLKSVVESSSDTALKLAAIKELSVVLAELGRNREAVSFLEKAEALDPDDPFFPFEKGWGLLSLADYRRSRSAFERALTLTAETDMAGQARFGLARAEAHLGDPSATASSLQTVYQKYPYLLSPAAEAISAQYEAMKKREHAITFLKEALTYDPRNIQAELDLAGLYEESGHYLPAWQTWYTISELDPDDRYAAGKTAGLARRVAGRHDNLLYWNRMAAPAHMKPLDYPDKDRIRIGLFSDSGNGPSPLTGFGFIANTGFTITDSRLGTVPPGGKAGMQYSVRYDPAGGICEIRDGLGSVMHSTRNSFRLSPQVAGGIILIKNPEPAALRGGNRGDRETAGELSVIMKEKGFILVNTVPREALVPSVVTALAGGSRLMEELKALAVVVRSKLAYLKNGKRHDDPDFELCDSPHCLEFPGLQMENEYAAGAAEATRGEALFRDGEPAEVFFHAACGGFTEDGADDKGRALSRLTPFSLYHLTLKAPPGDLLCLADDKTSASDVSWTLMLEPKWIENRVNSRTRIGRIRSMTVLKRRANGKAETLRIEGTKGTAVLNGFDAISQALAGRTLRSPLFTMRPVFEGKYPGYFLLRGVGTGDGRGYCLLGGHGMAQVMGSGYPEILKHYFPSYRIAKPDDR